MKWAYYVFVYLILTLHLPFYHDLELQFNRALFLLLTVRWHLSGGFLQLHLTTAGPDHKMNVVFGAGNELTIVS